MQKNAPSLRSRSPWYFLPKQTHKLPQKCSCSKCAELLRMAVIGQYVKPLPVSVPSQLGLGEQFVPSQLLNPDLGWKRTRAAEPRSCLWSLQVKQWFSSNVKTWDACDSHTWIWLCRGGTEQGLFLNPYFWSRKYRATHSHTQMMKYW